MRKRFARAAPIIDVNARVPADDMAAPNESDDESPPRARDSSVSPPRGQRVDPSFWDVIAQLEWRAASEGPINDAKVRATLAGQPPSFMIEYRRHYDAMEEILTRDGVFERHNVAAESRPRIISHFIAMGHDVYATMCTELSMVDFLVGENDFQSLARYLKHDNDRNDSPERRHGGHNARPAGRRR